MIVPLGLGRYWFSKLNNKVGKQKPEAWIRDHILPDTGLVKNKEP